MDQMNVMYGIADCYVSPYRAEGFNLPVLEAMVCGTPVIVTRGGATEDFIDGELSRSIDAEQFHNAVIQTKEISGYCEPNLEHLVQLILETSPKDLVRIAPIPASGSALGWNSVVDSLLTLMK
jgi:glycosyltransferase involved in cell wall biosynthesis